MTGIHHWTRGYDGLENKLALMGAKINLYTETEQVASFNQAKSAWEQVTK